MPFPIRTRLRRLTAPTGPAGVFVGLLALAAWLDAGSTALSGVEARGRPGMPATAQQPGTGPAMTGMHFLAKAGAAAPAAG